MIVTFDIETTEDMKQATCAAIAVEGMHTITFHSGDGIPMNEVTLMELLDQLSELHKAGYTITTWNGVGFDFKVLHGMLKGHPSLQKAVVHLAKQHVDLMYFIFCCMGYPCSQKNALAGTNLQGKVSVVVLKDGSTTEISGAQAPMLWDAGETAAVLEYLRGDVTTLLELAKAWRRKGVASWLTSKGSKKILEMTINDGQEVPLTVEYCSSLPLPDTSWMTNPKSRRDMVGWMMEV